MNKLERVDFPIKELASGDKLSLSLFKIESGNPGPHIHVQASVHGAELQGNAVIYHLMDYFIKNSFNGTISFVPLANPTATNTKIGTYTYGRFNPITGHNWNRCYEDIMTKSEDKSGFNLKSFAEKHINSPWSKIKSEYKKELFNALKSYENFLSKKGENENKFLFLFLQKMAANADYVLDLHTGPTSTRYIYSALYQKKSVVEFNFPFVLNIPNEFGQAMDEATFMPWVQLQQEMKKLGKDIPLEFEAFTLELGHEEKIDLNQGLVDCKHILNYLQSKSIFPVKNDFALPKIKQHHTDLANYQTLYAPQGGLAHFHSPPGSFIKKGEKLATILNFKKIHQADDMINGLFDILAPEDCFIINHCPSSAIHKGMELFAIMTKFEVIN